MDEIYNIAEAIFSRIADLDAKKAEQQEARGRSRYQKGEQPVSDTTPNQKSSGWEVRGCTVADNGAEQPLSVYTGADMECGLCNWKLVKGVRVCRLQCRHAFHYQCMEHFKQAEATNVHSVCCTLCYGVAR